LIEDTHVTERGGGEPVPRRAIWPKRVLPPGTVVGKHYEVAHLLGEGGMGMVYKGHDLVRERPVAIKALHSNLLGDVGLRKRFVREAKVMTEWSHPNVVAVYDFVEAEDTLAIIMEFVDGPSLAEHLREWGGQMPFPEVRSLMKKIVVAMGEAHRAGVVHRDLKPDNILLQPKGKALEPKIVDFGVAKVLQGTRYTVTGTLLGTCRYMSPEQVSTPDDLDHRSDIYSLGVTLYQLVTGRCPFDKETHFATMMAHVREAPDPPSRLRPDVPPALEALILATLAKDRAERPPTCEELAERLDDAVPRDAGRSAPSGPASLPSMILEPDGGELVLVGEGPFLMGPGRRQVYLDGFYVDRTPVTNRQFARFLEVTKYAPHDEDSHRFLLHWRRGEPPPNLLDHPVVFVARQDAVAFANWAGKRLLTEAEWEKAARGPDGRKYPWGKDQPDETRANFGRRQSGTTAVDAHPLGASPYGVLDLAGNVWEWCQDVDDPTFYEHGPSHNPRNTVRAKNAVFVVRGGSWLYDAASLRTYARSSFEPGVRVSGLGFRCGRTA
jgi:serine/threonine-protein kinase